MPVSKTIHGANVVDPWNFGADPDPRIHTSDWWFWIWMRFQIRMRIRILLFSSEAFKTSIKKLFKVFCFLHFHNFSKIKSQKEVPNQYKSMFFLLFLLDDRRIQIWICNTARYRCAVSQLLMLHYLCGKKETVTFFIHCSLVPWHNHLKKRMAEKLRLGHRRKWP
jgi:hypothetical protein